MNCNSFFSDFVKMSSKTFDKNFPVESNKLKNAALLTIGSFGAWYLMQKYRPAKLDSTI